MKPHKPRPGPFHPAADMAIHVNRCPFHADNDPDGGAEAELITDPPPPGRP